MSDTKVHTTLSGQVIDLSNLDAEEQALLAVVRERATDSDWDKFDNFWTARVAEFYDARGLARRQSVETGVYRVAQDLSSRLAVAAGRARVPDYRDQLETLIRNRYRTRREFCKATGIAEDMLSHVLSRRRNMSLDALTSALNKIGYQLQITPVVATPPPGNREAVAATTA